MSTEEDVRRLALALPHTSERIAYRTPAFYVGTKMFARITDEPDVVVLWRADLGEREALLRTEPHKFFTTDHYRGHPSVLVRLLLVEVDELAELLEEAWASRALRRHLSDLYRPIGD